LSKFDLPTKIHLESVIRGQKSQAPTTGLKLTFLSNDSQEKIVKLIAESITNILTEKLFHCRAWSIMVDTTPDVAHNEQISICCRIISPDGEASEHLLACRRICGTTSAELYAAIISVLNEKSISLSKLVAQTYDGASNMSGEYSGLQALVRQNIGDRVTFVHCNAHILNLVL
jgi:hypothetical protein